METSRVSFEATFFDQELLRSPFVQRLRSEFLDTWGTIFANPFRSYRRLLELLADVHSYKPEHARSFIKRLKTQGADHRNGHAIFSEVIVYGSYLPLVHEGALSGLHLDKDDFDIRIDRCDGTSYYLECFCVMPDKTPDSSGLVHIKTHLQDEFASIRGKIVGKVARGQMTKPRENWVVIELNDSSIAGDFAVLSSLSDGFKVSIDRRTGESRGSGYDWSDSFFDQQEARFIRGIMWFDLGAYSWRRTIHNPSFSGTRTSASATQQGHAAGRPQAAGG